MLSFWRTLLIIAFLHVHRPILSLIIGQSFCLAGPLSELNLSDHRRIVLTVLLFLQSADCTLFFIGCFSLSSFDLFSQKMVSTHTPSFGVNNPFAPKFA
jgi:hypothetical protein